MMPHLRNDASPLNIGRPTPAVTEKTMPDPRANSRLVKAVLTDLQFWVPVAVLAAGLIVLRWIS